MVEATETESRKLLRRLREAMASDEPGQARLDRITHLIADSMETEVCSIYLFRDEETLELCATEGLAQESVHQTRLRLGEGLVGRVAKYRKVINTPNAPAAKGFRFMPETGEERVYLLPWHSGAAAGRNAGRAGGAVARRTPVFR